MGTTCSDEYGFKFIKEDSMKYVESMCKVSSGYLSVYVKDDHEDRTKKQCDLIDPEILAGETE